jgi:hypothetical protein
MNRRADSIAEHVVPPLLERNCYNPYRGRLPWIVTLLVQAYCLTMNAQAFVPFAPDEGQVARDNIVTNELDHKILPAGVSSDDPLPDAPSPIDKSTGSADRSNKKTAEVVVARPTPPPAKFNFKVAFWQTFGENLSFHAFRVATDPGMRWNLIHKPFVHDWFVSYQGIDLHRWGDGDDFVVNNLGHPLEGAVFARTFLQNSPASQVPIGKDSRYWISRLKATAWAAVWSTQLEIGPISETSIGNQGGFTYVPICGTELFCLNNPKYPKPPTNNTGWTDYVVTPLAGIGWVFAEDTAEKYIVAPIAVNHRILGGRVLRSALEPTRSFAAIFAGKYPWELPSADNGFVASQKSRHVPKFGTLDPPPVRRLEFGTQYTSISLPVLSSTCPGYACRKNLSGLGTNFDFNFTHGMAFDSTLNFIPEQQGSKSMVEGLFGFRIGARSQHVGVFAKLRPGFIYYESAQPVRGVAGQASLTRFVTDAGGIVEYYPNHTSTLRFDVGTTIVRYLTNHTDPHDYALGSLLSTDYIVTQGNFQMSTSYQWRF